MTIDEQWLQERERIHGESAAGDGIGAAIADAANPDDALAILDAHRSLPMLVAEVRRLQAALANEREFRRILIAARQQPLAPEADPIWNAWITLAVDAGVISGGRAAELTGVDVCEWRRMQVSTADALELLRRSAHEWEVDREEMLPASAGARRLTIAERFGDRETLGRIVREVWVAFAKEQPNPKPHHLVCWDEIDELSKEVDRRIGAAIAAYVLEGKTNG